MLSSSNRQNQNKVSCHFLKHRNIQSDFFQLFASTILNYMFLFAIGLRNMILLLSVDLRSPVYDRGWQVVNNSPIQDYTYPDDYVPRIYDMNRWLWVQTVHCIFLWLWMVPEIVVWCLNIFCFVPPPPPPHTPLWINPIKTILTCILIFFSKEKKRSFRRTSTILQTF